MRLTVLSLSLAIFAAATGGRISASDAPARPNATPTSPRTADPWRRTAQGWERILEAPRPLRTPRAGTLHPSVVASLQIMVSFGGLIYFSAAEPKSA